ncbi:50S ribosomal protein L24 [Blochmannia endosymbiont of Polyrhachis (Hedomyrma) turneri]|uniref:50S ribosomal protein L24 n=1 Tax=Blochmannia endosymbiont of Polyrhachis (Hedomyrma) turneri TaxID=1505596 RepID=UPI00061A5F22|nr:50S ribosomal protein L24 [Blochmannia endosymbiont of Polyrhachis (Hedomyrma) turneri]AKC59780.1 50S ribosomal protein L24 [Blochmannia endosymbiont of Polyrhachis (Hedomyrma) turneri]
MARKIRCNDEVIVLTGKDKGKRGRVQSIVSPNKAIITGINVVKKHQKPIPAINQPGGVIKKEKAIDLSNVAIFNHSSFKADRVGFRMQGCKKVRILKSSGKVID